jgi:uncharacterized protein
MGHFAVDEPALNPLFETIAGLRVYWELSGWAPKYLPPSPRADIRGRLREKIMFGSDHPSLAYDRILREWDELGYDQTVMDLVFHANAERVLGP